MPDTLDRANTPVSTIELQRRWSAVRSAMAAAGIDVLLMQGNNDFMGGNVKWFSDLPATNGYPVTIVFPRDDDMTLVRMGPFGQVQESALESGRQASGHDGAQRGILRAYGTPHFVTARYTDGYDAELVEKACAPYRQATVGLLNRATLGYALMDHLTKDVLGAATLVDASDLVDLIKAEKSDEELDLIRRTAAMQDQVMEAVARCLRPGLRDRDVVGIATAQASRLGSEQGWYMAASGPVGTPAVMAPPHLQNRVMQAGDQFCILLENNGPGGHYGELGRTFVLGRASAEMQDEFAIVCEAQALSHTLLRPGASCRDIWDANNAFMRARGRPEETRVYAHGQGYDMVERPLVRFDETMTIGARMNLAVHPTYVTPTTYSWVCDNVIVHEHGVEPIHRYPQRITEV